MQKISEKFFLSAAEIDRFSEMAAGLLQQTNVNSKDILRFRLSMENVMDIWLRELGEGISCSFSSGSKFGRAYIVLTADGKKVNPNEYQDELRAGISNGSSLLAALGLTLEYRYEAGQNILKLTLPKGQAGQLMPVLICMLAGALFGGVFEFVFPEAGGVVQEWVVSPVFDTLMNLLSVIAGPMMFLAVYSGIYGIGDTLIFGKIGRHLIVRFLLPTFLIALSTASSSAAFGTNIECCERKLGIDRKLVNFGVPMGQVVYMPIGAVMFLIASLCIGESYGVEISMAWVLTAIFVSGILAAATPPIPGGAMSCYTILFTQLGIPAAGIALAISVDLIMDYFITACNPVFDSC